MSDTESSASSEGASPLSALPTIPDLRFEQSYLATIRGFLHELDKDEAEEEKKEEERMEEKGTHKTHKIQRAKSEHELWLGGLRVEWMPLLYVTMRDQILSPLVQGAVWGLGGILLSQFRHYLNTPKHTHTGGAKAQAGQSRSLLKALGLR